MKKDSAPYARERSFGLAVGGMLVVIAAFMLWRGRMLPAQTIGALGAFLVLFGFAKPRILVRPAAVWWKLATVLGYVNARIILTVIFALVLVPIGAIWRLIGRDPLTRRRASWQGWSQYPPRYRDRAHYKRMY